MQLFIAGNDYIPDSAKWDELSESQRQAIWEINYYGYSYPGHESENYYVATQIMIWQVVTAIGINRTIWMERQHMIFQMK